MGGKVNEHDNRYDQDRQTGDLMNVLVQWTVLGNGRQKGICLKRMFVFVGQVREAQLAQYSYIHVVGEKEEVSEQVRFDGMKFWLGHTYS